jgi:hypothetical protein
MSALIIVGLVLACIILAARYGYDSRDTLRSHEQQLAAHGVTWRRDAAHEQELAQELSAALQRTFIAATEEMHAAHSAYPHLNSLAMPKMAAKAR